MYYKYLQEKHLDLHIPLSSLKIIVSMFSVCFQLLKLKHKLKIRLHAFFYKNNFIRTTSLNFGQKLRTT